MYFYSINRIQFNSNSNYTTCARTTKYAWLTFGADISVEVSRTDAERLQHLVVAVRPGTNAHPVVTALVELVAARQTAVVAVTQSPPVSRVTPA